MITRSAHGRSLTGGFQRVPGGAKKPGLADVAKMGRRGDTMLAHINPEEAKLLKAHGGAGTRNPMTGLPEFNQGPPAAPNWKQIADTLINSVLRRAS